MPVLNGPDNFNNQFTVAADGTISLTTTPLPIGGGTISPGPVVISNNTAAPQASPANTLLQLAAVDGGSPRILIDGYGINGSVTLRRSDGTAAAPTAVLANDALGAIGWIGRGATAYSPSRIGINGVAAQNWTDTAQGTFLNFSTTPNGTVATAEAMRIDHNGNVGIGTTTPQAKLEVNQNAANPALYTGAEVARFAAADSTACIVGAYSFSGAASGSAPGVVLHKKRGTGAAPTATQLGDNVGFITWNNFDGTNEHQAATINVTAAENTTSTNAGGILNFNTAGIGQNSVTQRMVIDGNGNVGIGTAGPQGALSVERNTASSTSDLIQSWTWTGGPTIYGLRLYQRNTGSSIVYDLKTRAGSTTDVNVLTFDTSGNVGIGNVAPGARLHVGASATSGGQEGLGCTVLLTAPNDGNNPLILQRSGVVNPQMLNFSLNHASHWSEIQSAQSNVGFTSLVLNRQGGNVGIGNAAPGFKLSVVAGADNAWAAQFSGLPASDCVLIGTVSGVPWIIANNNASSAWAPLFVSGTYTALGAGGVEAMRIIAGGNVGIGTTGPLAKLHIQGQAAAGGIASLIMIGPNGADGTTNLVLFKDAGNTVTVGQIARTGTNAVAYNTTSDARLKTNIVESERGLDALMAIKVSDYKMGKTASQGLLAQDVAKVYPEAVHEGGDDPNLEPWMLDYGRLTPLIIKGFQQQQEMIAALQAKVAALESATVH